MEFAYFFVRHYSKIGTQNSHAFRTVPAPPVTSIKRLGDLLGRTFITSFLALFLRNTNSQFCFWQKTLRDACSTRSVRITDLSRQMFEISSVDE